MYQYHFFIEEFYQSCYKLIEKPPPIKFLNIAKINAINSNMKESENPKNKIIIIEIKNCPLFSFLSKGGNFYYYLYN